MHPFVLVSSLALLVTNVAATCYGFNGGNVDTSFIPCDPSAKVSACCASNKPGGDVCLDGGLCLAASGGFSGFIYGNGCTDKSGQDPACPQICPASDSSFWNGSPPTAYNLVQCTPGTWCCRAPQNVTSCCNDKRAQVQWKLTGDNIFLPGLLVGNTLAAVTSSSAGSARTSAASGTSSTAKAGSTTACASAGGASSSLECSSGTSAGTVGAAVGATLGVMLLVAIGTIAYMAAKIKNLKRGYKENVPAYTPPMMGQQHQQHQAQHIPSSDPKFYPGPQPMELPGSGAAPNGRYVEAP